MCIHGFQGGNDGAYQPVPFDQWKASVEHAKELGDVWIGTMEDIGAYWLGQKAFTNAMKTTAGTDQTWAWDLPDNFPPGKFLRVKVAGGTLKQGGTEIAWHGNGYYEIALDAGSVTLSALALLPKRSAAQHSRHPFERPERRPMPALA